MGFSTWPWWTRHMATAAKISGGVRFGGIFDRYKMEPFRPALRSVQVPHCPELSGGGYGEQTEPCSRTGGTWAAKYAKKIIAWDVAPGKEYFDELFRVSREQIIWGGNYFALPPSRCFLIWRKLTISENFSMAMAEYAWTSLKGNAKVFECVPQGDKTDKRFLHFDPPFRTQIVSAERGGLYSEE